MGKHLLALIATLLAFGVSLAMFSQLVGVGSPWMVALSFLCVLGLVRIAEPVYALRMPGSLRAVRPWEFRGNVYRTLRVPEFGTLLKRTPLRLLNPAVYLSRQPDPVRIGRLLESAEAAHFWAGLLLVPYLAFCVWTGQWAILACFLLLQVLGNAYPIMHLRFVRGRLDRLRSRTLRPERVVHSRG